METGRWETPQDYKLPSEQTHFTYQNVNKLMWDYSRHDRWGSGANNESYGLQREVTMAIYADASGNHFAVMDFGEWGAYDQMFAMGSTSVLNSQYQNQGTLMATVHSHPWLHGNQMYASTGDIDCYTAINYPNSIYQQQPGTNNWALTHFDPSVYRDINHYIVTAPAQGASSSIYRAY
jgi:hypothetical protein